VGRDYPAGTRMVKDAVVRVISSDWQDVAVRGSHTGRRPLPAVHRVGVLQAARRTLFGIPSLPVSWRLG